jgi:phosphoribosylformylglycinamidine synthase
MKVGVIQFPGTNCDRDVLSWLQKREHKASFVWHQDLFESKDYEALVLPGGFSHGDYLRSGAMAARSPVMKSVKEFADKGKPVLGICNGFQILCEANILPGALLKNEGRRFVDDWVELEVVNTSPYFAKGNSQKTLKLPVAHGDGRYFIPGEQVVELIDQQQIWLKYKNNPNGSLANIAGVFNAKKNVAGLMPHPERAIVKWMGGVDGWDFL